MFNLKMIGIINVLDMQSKPMGLSRDVYTIVVIRPWFDLLYEHIKTTSILYLKVHFYIFLLKFKINIVLKHIGYI